MSLTQAGRQMSGNNPASNIPYTNEQNRPRMRPAAQYNGSRMDDLLAGQDYTRTQNQNLSQTAPQNNRQNQNQLPEINDKMTLSENQRQDRFTAQAQREKFPMNQRPASYVPQQPQQDYQQQQPQNKAGTNDQDKMIQYLLDQVQNLERGLNNESKKNLRSFQELEREVRSNQVRSSDQPNNQIINDMENKLFTFESKFLREEKSKNELQQKILLQDQSIKELMYLMKNTQHKDTNDILQMRGMIQEKITDEGLSLQKEREKSKALFMEVVRLGEGQDRVSESLTQVSMQYEQRIQSLEVKIYSGEKALVQVAQKGESGMNFINDWNDKLERRVMMLESNILTLGKEQLKDRDQIFKIDNITQRLSEDLKQMLYNIQQDFQTRLEARVTELINRIVMEHEQRVKQYEDIKSNFDIREKLNSERWSYEREEMRERLASLEQVIRSDSLRKEEAIRQLSTLVESQVAAIYSNIKNEEASRYAHEIALRNDLLKIQENIKQENDMFKNYQSSVTEKMTDMIRIEVQNRLSSDVDLKNLTSAIAQDIVADLNNVKDTIDTQNKKIVNQLREIERDTSEKAQRLSMYVDEEITKMGIGQGRKYEKMKIIFTKLAEQFKQHLMNTEQNRQEIDSRVKFLEQNIETIRGDFQVILDDLQEHLLTRMAEDKNELITQTSNSIKLVEDKTNKLEEEQNKNFQIMKVAIEENHTIFTQQMKLILEQNDIHHKETKSQIQLIVQGVIAVRESIKLLEQQLGERLIPIQDQVYAQQSDLQKIQDRCLVYDEKFITTQSQLDSQNEHISQLKKDLDGFDIQLKEFHVQFLKVQEDLIKFNENLNQIQQTQEKINENQELIVESIQKFKHTQELHSQEFEVQKTKNQELSNADQQINVRITDEILAQQAQDKLDVAQFQLATDDRMVAIEQQDQKKDLETREIQQNIVLLQDKIQTLTKLEN